VKSAIVGFSKRSGWQQRLELADALEEEEELRGKRVAAHVAVELRQERIRIGFFQQEGRAHPRAQPLARLVLPQPMGPSTTM
jgi:hypothetical protein